MSRTVEINVGRFGVTGVGISSIVAETQINGDVWLHVYYNNSTDAVIKDASNVEVNFKGPVAPPFLSSVIFTDDADVSPATYNFIIMQTTATKNVVLHAPGVNDNKVVTIKNLGTPVIIVYDADGHLFDTSAVTSSINGGTFKQFIYDINALTWWTI